MTENEHRRERRWQQAAGDLAAVLREAADRLTTTEQPAQDLADLAVRAEVVLAGLTGSGRPYPATATEYGRGDLPFSPVVGALNPTAIPLVVQRTGDLWWAEYVVPQRFEGPPGLVHGGFSAFLLDEVLGQVVSEVGAWMLTARLELKYRRPLPLHTPLRITARMDSVDGRRATVRGAIALAAEPDRPCVEAVGGFTEPRAETRSELFDPRG